jgi:hypothetical protein
MANNEQIDVAEFEILRKKHGCHLTPKDVSNFAKQFNIIIHEYPDAFSGLSSAELEAG